MKKLSYLLFAIVLVVNQPIFSQISINHQNKANSRQPTFNIPIVPHKILNAPIEDGSYNLNIYQNDNNAKGMYYRSMSFDPVWADRFQTVLDSLIDVSNVPGASLAVLSPGQGMFYGVSGISSAGIPITPEMRFGIGSNTKLFMAVVLLKLQEEDMLSLDDALYQWLPSIPYIDSTATIRQMLAHQSGFFDYFNDNPSLITDSTWADTSRFWTVEEVLATIGEPHFTPGTGWGYSNTNYMLAGEIIEAVTGSNWVDYFHNYIFDPLNMDSTFIGAYEPRNGPVAAEWDYFTGQIIINSPMTAEYSMMHAAGGILSAAGEMASWYDALLGGDLLTDTSMQELMAFEPIWYYGLGIWANQYFGKLAYSHSGGTLGYLSLMWYDVDSESILCVLYNGRDAVSTQFIALLDVLYKDFPKEENDAGIQDIISPWSNICIVPTSPLLVLKNHGSELLTSVEINYFLDEDSVSTINWMGTLGAGDTVHLLLDEIMPDEGHHTFISYTSQPNGQSEGYLFNDTARSNFIVNTVSAILAPLEEGFENMPWPPDGWSLGSNSIFDWRDNFIVAYNGEGTAMKNNYNDISFGFHYDLDLPLINISGGNNPALNFTYAYAKYPMNNNDSLMVLISSDCGNTWDVLFNKGGSLLSSASPTYNPFYPTSASHWKQESISLDAYQGDMMIRFRAVCGGGNNLYLDDIAVLYTVGTENIPGEMSFSVYPNPTSDVITVSGIPPQSEILITDITGKTLYRLKSRDAETIIDLSSFPQGIYFLITDIGSMKVVVL